MLEVSILPPAEQLPNRADQPAIFEDRGDREMKLPIKRNPAVGAAAAFILLRQDPVGVIGMSAFRERSCLRGNRSLDDSAGMQDVEGSVRCDGVGRSCRTRSRVSQNVNARTAIDADAAFDLQDDKRFAYARARDAKPVRELAPRGQPPSDRVFTLVDQLTRVIGDLSVKPARLSSLEQRFSPVTFPA